MTETVLEVSPKTYMIKARRSSSDTSFCEIGAVKNSLRIWATHTYDMKKNQRYSIYKFNSHTGKYHLIFDGTQASDLFVDKLKSSEIEQILNAIHTTL